MIAGLQHQTMFSYEMVAIVSEPVWLNREYI